jgi:hypothetical protein
MSLKKWKRPFEYQYEYPGQQVDNLNKRNRSDEAIENTNVRHIKETGYGVNISKKLLGNRNPQNAAHTRSTVSL